MHRTARRAEAASGIRSGRGLPPARSPRALDPLSRGAGAWVWPARSSATTDAARFARAARLDPLAQPSNDQCVAAGLGARATAGLHARRRAHPRLRTTSGVGVVDPVGPR